MKLSVDLNALNLAVDSMGASDVDFTLNQEGFKGIDIDEILNSTGQEISLEDLESVEGLLSYHGRQVLLYIPDHSYKLEKVNANPELGNKFHVADCKTLNDMRSKKRFDRYIVTNNLSGDFDVTGMDSITRKELNSNIRLTVCKNCLSMLNYRNYKKSKNKKEIFNDFSLNDFFEHYSTLFKYLPKHENLAYSANYTLNWKDISEKNRIKKNFTCESCKTSFITNKRLLHSHHINGIKSDNREVNLKALCIDCHRKEPNHSHLMMKYSDLLDIYKLRKEQKKLDIKSWDDVFKYTDLSLHGYLHLLKEKKPKAIPNIAHSEVLYGKEVFLDLAWPKLKKAVLINNSVSLPGWDIITLEEALLSMNN